MASKNTNRAELRKAYLFVVDNWAVGADEVARAIGSDTTTARTRLVRLAQARLVEGSHVNGEKALTWQSYYSIQDGDDRKLAVADFDKAFPKGEDVTTKQGATGPRYTAKQIETAIKMRAKGESWKAIAAAVKVKSPAYFAKVIKEEIASRAKVAKKAAKDKGKRDVKVTLPGGFSTRKGS